MSPARPRVLLGVAAAAACLIALAACGDNANPTANPSLSESGSGEFGGETATPTTDATTQVPVTTTTTGGGGGNTNPPQNNPYPNNAKDYGLAILTAIKDSDDGRIVDLSSLHTAQYVQTQNYKAKNGSWVFANCDSGGTQVCHYYNQTGDFADVAVDTSKLGQKGAVSSVSMLGGTFPTDAANYVGSFVYNWTFDGAYSRMRAFATQSVVDFANSHQKLNAGNGGTSGQTTNCPSGNAGKVCVEAYSVGGSLTIDYTFIVDPSKLGKPNAIVGVVD